jgi:sec-independent protein translocase protein TatC
MATAIRPIGHEDELTLVDHLDELRARLIVSAVVLAIAFAFCLWQNHGLLHILNRPLEKQTQRQVEKGHGPLGQTALAQQGVLALARTMEHNAAILIAPSSGLPAATRAALARQLPQLRADVARIPPVPEGNKTVTLGIGEPFTVTMTVSLLFALVLSLPVILFELGGFMLPALSPRERRAALPLLAAIPCLFAVGVVFGYFVVLPAAVRFFQNFNSDEFNVLVQAGPYYKFAATTLLAMGLIFQVPVAILAATRAGIVTPRQLRRGRRYAIVVCAVIAALLPGDAITMLLETVPLYLLYEASILLASFLDRSKAIPSPAADGPPVGGGGQGGGSAGGGPQAAGALSSSKEDSAGPSVQDMINHVDRELQG